LVFNEKEGNWEVSIRLFQDDLEQGLSHFKGKRFQFQQAQGAEELIQEFVKKTVWIHGQPSHANALSL